MHVLTFFTKRYRKQLYKFSLYKQYVRIDQKKETIYTQVTTPQEKKS